MTEGCQGCLAHPCVEVCPKKAVTLDRTNGRSVIDTEKCIKCGKCAEVCSYNAIIVQERPCAKACGMDAIGSDENGKAEIDSEKCVSCGQCLVNCPFGAISDKSQIFQVIRAMQSGERVYAALAPAFVGQFGAKVTPGKLRSAMKMLGFADILKWRLERIYVRHRKLKILYRKFQINCRLWQPPVVRHGLLWQKNCIRNTESVFLWH